MRVLLWCLVVMIPMKTLIFWSIHMDVSFQVVEEVEDPQVLLKMGSPEHLLLLQLLTLLKSIIEKCDMKNTNCLIEVSNEHLILIERSWDSPR